MKYYKLGRYRDKRLSFDSAQDDVTLSGVEVLTTLNFLYIKLPFDNIWEPDKPIGVAYIDDKGINFDNNWGEITNRLVTKFKKNK
jgi:hypothetical protein